MPPPQAAAHPRSALRIALTGGIGCGKTTVAAAFARLGAGVIDADAISRELTAAGGTALAEIVRQFGREMIGPDGAMDRARMRARVFADSDARVRLESILHPRIADLSAARGRDLEARGAPVLIFDIPLLVESGLRRAAPAPHRVLVVDCPVHRQIERTLSRGILRRDEIEAIVAVQAPRAARLAAADDVLVNDGSPGDLCARVALLWEAYLGASGCPRVPA